MPEGEMETLLTRMRRTALFQLLIPQEAATGFPAALLHNGILYAILIFFGRGHDSQRKAVLLYPPLATITVEWATKRPVEYVDVRFRYATQGSEWHKSVGTFPHTTVAHLTVNDYRIQRRSLFALYDELFAALAVGQPPAATLQRQFSLLLQLLIEPPLEPYYRQIAPDFFNQYLGTGGR